MRRTYWYYAALALVVLVVAYLLFAHRSTSVRNYPSEGTDIILFGDSSASGVGAPEGQDLASDLSAQIGERIINLGRSGDTTKDALARVGEFKKYDPKIIIIELGGNDYLRHLSMDDAFKNLGGVIAAAQDTGAAVLLVGLRLSPLVGNFDKEFTALSKKYATAYVPDALDGIFGNKELMANDIHPNAAGYKLMASRIAPELKRLFK